MREPREAQDHPRSDPRGSQERSKVLQRGVKREPRQLQDHPREESRGQQERSRVLQGRVKRESREAPDHPRGSQERPKVLQRGVKKEPGELQDHPREESRGSQDSPKPLPGSHPIIKFLLWWEALINPSHQERGEEGAKRGPRPPKR